MKWFRQTLRNNRVFLLTVLAVNIFYMVEGVRFVEARQLRLQEEERHLEELSAVFDIPMERLRGDSESLSKPIKQLVVDGVGSAVEAGFGRLQKIVRQRKDQALSHLSQTQERVGELIRTAKRSLASGPQVQIAAAFPQERPSPIQASGKERVSRAPHSRERSASSLRASGGIPLPLWRVEKKVRSEEVSADGAKPSRRVPAKGIVPTPIEVVSKDGIAPELMELAESLGNAPARILAYVHDNIDFDPKWGAAKPPLGTLWEKSGTSWEQAWLLRDLLTAAGVDARFEWGIIEVPTELITNLTGLDDPWRAGDLLTTAGVPIVLLTQGGEVVGARMSHVWVKGWVDYIPHRGAAPGPGDYWIRMDPTFKRFAIADGVRLDDQVPFDLGEYLESGTPFSPRQVYEEALQAHIADNNLGITLEEVKPSKTVIQDAFPFLPGSLRGRILTFEGESPEVPAAFQQRLDLELRNAAGGVLATWSTPWSAVGGKRLEVAWPGATDADQAALDLYGSVFATPPYEVDLKPVIRVDGVEVAAGGAIGSAEEAVMLTTITPPQGSPTVMQFEMLAGEHGVFTVDFGQMPQEVIDHYTQELSAATDPIEEEAWTLALAGALYQRLLSGDLEHLAGLRWQRLVQLGTAVLAVQRGAVSTAPDGTPLVFSKGPMSLDLGAMPLGLFPASGAAGSTVPTLELLGSQGSFLEGEALSQVIGGEQLTAVTFLTRAFREGQILTLVDAGNVDEALAAAELSEEAEAHVRAGVAQGKIAWISESQLPVDTWQTSGYILEDPDTGAGGYFVTFERLVEGMEANIVFHSPQDLDVVTAPIDVVATIESEALDSWTLSYQFVGEGQPVVLATGTGSVSNATLAQFDPTLLLNGLYDIVLTGRDIAGQSVSGNVSVSVEGNMKIGNFTLSFIDLAIPLSGLDIEIVRTYDSRQRELKGDFGYGWTLDIRQGSYQNNRPPGDGWQIVNPGGPFGLPCSAIIESKSHLTTVRLSDQEIYRFRLKLVDPAVLFGGCQARAVFEWIDGPLPGTTLEILGNDEVIYENESNRVLDDNSFEVFEPEDVRLTTRDGRIFELDLRYGVTIIEDLNGNQVAISPDAITHSSGRGVSMERDQQGRITSITDPMGRATHYAYGAEDELLQVTDREGGKTHFTYEPNHYLIEIENALGVKAVRNDYDNNGRLIRHTDALGKVTEFQHNLVGRQEIITNRLGHSKLLEYDQRGNVVRELDEADKETKRTFDARGNLLTETDPLEHTTTFVYTADNDLERVIDPLGNTTSHTYNARGQVLTITDPRSNITANVYDNRGNLIQITDAPGKPTTFTYDVKGNLRTITDAQDNVTEQFYDGFGNLVREVDALGAETSYTYDENGHALSATTSRTTSSGTETLVTTFIYDDLGRLTSTTAPDGSTTSTIYDLLGRVVRIIDPLSRATTFAYDAQGRKVSTTFADGTEETRDYDAEGRLTARTDQAGRTTSYSYDAVGRLVGTTFPDGATTSTLYDDAGQPIGLVDARSNVTTLVYDVAGRQTAEIDALDHARFFGYDAAGNLISTTDAKGNTTTFEYDGVNRLIRTIFADGTTEQIGYDSLGRPISATDQAGKTTRFGYDAVGRLTSVTDALGQMTSYSYDELGNRLTQTDANGHTTRLEYDARGRQLRRILPDGDHESMTYHGDGTLASRTDFNGSTTTYTYDKLGRLIQRTYPDSSTVSFTYTTAGRRHSATDARGTTTYTHDTRDRLIAFTYPDGRQLTYTYDLAGNLTGLTAKIGQETLSTTYTHDSLNRLSTVTDPDGGVYTYTYDKNGIPTSLGYPNSVLTTTTYDSLDRLLSLTTLAANGQGSTLQSYSYTLNPTGRRTRIDEHDGTSRSYTYDDLYRLIQARVTNADAALVYQEKFTYDPVGNRLSRNEEFADGTVESATYTYDDRDRLVSESGVSYSWDANGNLIGTEGVAYVWDYENRLIGVTLGDETEMKFAYDVDGNRVRTEITANDGSQVAINDLVDISGYLSHVIMTSNSEGNVISHYIRGESLLAVNGSGAGSKYFFHLDGLGSVRLLTDSSPNVIGSYGFSAFGELLEDYGDILSSYLFAGEPLETDIGFYYNRARWMDPASGRFASIDISEGSQFVPISLHRYAYAEADPVNKLDPTGKFGVVDISVANAIRGIVTNIQIDIGSELLSAASKDDSVSRVLILVSLAAGGVALLRVVKSLAKAGARLLSTKTGTLIRAFRGSFGRSARELSRSADEVFEQAINRGPEIVRGFEIHGLKGMVSKTTFQRNIVDIFAQERGTTSIRGLLRGFEEEALAAGAKELRIVGLAVVEERFFNPVLAQKLGYTYRRIDNYTIELVKRLTQK